jgi:very-short-patch-repair endonuclease
LDEVLGQTANKFDQACERWRDLYRAAMKQRATQNRIIGDHTRSAADHAQARRLRQEAESQLELLTQAENVVQSDFYSYRYFAGEGFLPGYSFPRLPLSAYIPGRRVKTARDEFLSRPRFLAISEFGPRSVIYHEGSRYIINKVILPVGEDRELPTQQVKQCPRCGYLHPITMGDGIDKCERCNSLLDRPLRQLFRLQNVSTKRRDRINSDEEERLRLGYEIRTGVRFNEHGGVPLIRTSRVELGHEVLANLTYGHAAALWRINLGWTRRRNRDQYGFVLDIERGFWQRREDVEDDPDDPMSARTMRVVPFVEDHRNCLLFEPTSTLDIRVMASLQAALKRAIEVRYQLEDDELAAEPLPGDDNRRVLLFYEAAEGGAGVLRRLVDDPEGLAGVAREALRLCHFDPATGNDLRRAPRAREDCEAACYDCLMSYYNQRDHQMLDRQAIRDLLLQLASAHTITSPGPLPRQEHLQRLLQISNSSLEQEWLRYLDQQDLRLPSHAQVLIESCGTRPDFLFEQELTAVYVDGPAHDYPERQARDEAQTECMQDLGYTVIRFGYREDWAAKIAQYPHIFGSAR